MENRNMKTLDDVLNEFVAENDHPTAQKLEEWAKLYPQYQHELVDFAATWAEQIVLPPAPELRSDTEETLIDRAMSHVLNVAYLRDEMAQGVESKIDDGSIKNLTKQASHAGMNAHEFAKACVLDLALISKLNSRQIDPDTVPISLIRHIAQLLSKQTSAVVAYLNLPPKPIATSAFLSRNKPTNAKRQRFAEAVQSSSLSEEEKRRWLDNKEGQEKS